MSEEGSKIDDTNLGVRLLSACDECIHVYKLFVSPEEVCDGIPVQTPTYRGVSEVDNGKFQLFLFLQVDDEVQVTFLTEVIEVDNQWEYFP